MDLGTQNLKFELQILNHQIWHRYWKNPQLLSNCVQINLFLGWFFWVHRTITKINTTCILKVYLQFSIYLVDKIWYIKHNASPKIYDKSGSTTYILFCIVFVYNVYCKYLHYFLLHKNTLKWRSFLALYSGQSCKMLIFLYKNNL